jgi:serine/threonine protein kinase
MNRNGALREIHAMSALSAAGKCASLLQYYNVWQEGTQLYIQLEWCEHGSLSSQLADQKSTRTFDETRLIDICLQMSKVIHSQLFGGYHWLSFISSCVLSK